MGSWCRDRGHTGDAGARGRVPNSGDMYPGTLQGWFSPPSVPPTLCGAQADGLWITKGYAESACCPGPNILSHGSPALVAGHQEKVTAAACGPLGNWKEVSLQVLSNRWASWNFKFLSGPLPIFLLQGQAGGWGVSTNPHPFIYSFNGNLLTTSPSPACPGLGGLQETSMGFCPPEFPGSDNDTTIYFYSQGRNPGISLDSSLTPSTSPLLLFCSVLSHHLLSFIVKAPIVYLFLLDWMKAGTVSILFSAVFLALAQCQCLVDAH